jgi:hypothetical protein
MEISKEEPRPVERAAHLFGSLEPEFAREAAASEGISDLDIKLGWVLYLKRKDEEILKQRLYGSPEFGGKNG